MHYWLVGMRGGEKVIESLLAIYPNADIFCHVIDGSAISPKLAARVRKATFINRLPLSKRLYQIYLPFMPLALEQLDLRGYDLVISSESGPAKGVLTDPDALHICYCHSPMRYIWDMYHDYRQNAGWFKRLLMPFLAHYMRVWDVTSAHRVGHFVANSRFVAERIRTFYNRGAEVIHPPVAVNEFAVAPTKGDYFLLVGELVGYKRADLAVGAFSASGRKLKVVGGGECLASLSRAAPSNIEFLGKVGFSELKRMYSEARALIFPGVEDFGIVPVEAIASGTPVIAYRKGGALETVIEGKTGLFFDEQSEESLNAAVDQFECLEQSFDSSTMVEAAQAFETQVFLERFAAFVEQKMVEKAARLGCVSQSK